MEMITLKNKKPTLTESLRMGSGLLLVVSGVIMMMTIILILPGIGAFLVGILLMYFGRPKEPLNCRQCNGTVTARMGDKQAKCEHCNTVQPIKWTK